MMDVGQSKTRSHESLFKDRSCGLGSTSCGGHTRNLAGATDRPSCRRGEAVADVIGSQTYCSETNGKGY